MSEDVRPSTSSDALERLVDRAAQHDPDAWEQLYRHCYRPLFSYARRRLSDDRSAEDAVSETMTRALGNIERFRWEGAGFDGWVFGIARNVVLEMWRTGQRTVSLDHDQRSAPDHGPEEQAVADAEAASMRRAFERLDPEERELLELRVHAELSSEVVGKLLGKRPGAVRMSQTRALQRLRTFLEEVQRDV